MPRVLVIGIFILLGIAADWPQWQGPQRDNISQEKNLLKTWPAGGPPLVWTYKNAGIGYSSPAIVGDRLFLTGARGEEEFVFALDLKATPPKELWAVKIGPVFTFKQTKEWGNGPRITPTVDGDRVYALGGFGDLVCVDANKGLEVWRKNLPKDLKAEVNGIGGGPEKFGWGFSWAPLIDGNQLICVPGGPEGTLAALDKSSGAVLWRSKELTEQASYSSPIVAELGGVRQYVIATNGGLHGIEAKSGKLLWTYKRNYPDVLIPTPIALKDEIYLAAGFGAGCDLIKVAKNGSTFKATKVFANKEMKNDLGGVVQIDGHFYGYSAQRGWICQDATSGKQDWAEKQKLGPGSLTCADGNLYCYGEGDGTLVLVEANPKEWKEHGRFTIPEKSKLNSPSGKIWTHPVIANGKLYLRDLDLLFCYDIQDKAAAKP
jgi:outer membrane protein assembly factor BamB